MLILNLSNLFYVHEYFFELLKIESLIELTYCYFLNFNF